MKFKNCMRSTRGFLYDLPKGKGVLISDGANVKMTTGTSGFVLTSKGVDEEPVFEELPTTNLSGGQIGSVLYQSGLTTTNFTNAIDGVFAKNGSIPGFTNNVAMGSASTMLTMNATSTQNSIVINGANTGIGIQLRNPSNNTDLFLSKDAATSHGSITMNNNGTTHRWRYFTTGHFELPISQYASAPFLYTSSSGLIFKGTVLPVSAGGTGTNGTATTTTITVSRFGGNNLDSVTYTTNTVTYQKIGAFVTLSFNIECTIMVNGGGSCNLQIDLPITAAARELSHVYSTGSGIVRTGRVGPGAYNKIQILSTTGSLGTFSSGNHTFSGTFTLYSP